MTSRWNKFTKISLGSTMGRLGFVCFVGDVFFKDCTLGFITIKPPPLSDMFDLLPSAEQANLSTPPKFNMEAKNQTLEKEIPFGNHHFQVPCLSLGVYIKPSMQLQDNQWTSEPITSLWEIKIWRPFVFFRWQKRWKMWSGDQIDLGKWRDGTPKNGGGWFRWCSFSNRWFLGSRR